MSLALQPETVCASGIFTEGANCVFYMLMGSCQTTNFVQQQSVRPDSLVIRWLEKETQILIHLWASGQAGAPNWELALINCQWPISS